MQAATDSVCRLQQREQERKKVKVDHLNNGAYDIRAFIIILLVVAFDKINSLNLFYAVI